MQEQSLLVQRIARGRALARRSRSFRPIGGTPRGVGRLDEDRLTSSQHATVGVIAFAVGSPMTPCVCLHATEPPRRRRRRFAAIENRRTKCLPPARHRGPPRGERAGVFALLARIDDPGRTPITWRCRNSLVPAGQMVTIRDGYPAPAASHFREMA